jgi:arylsulfatase
MFCNRGIYHNGWTAVTRHSVPWDMSGPVPAFADDVWELYADTDWTQAHDLASEMPEKLAALQQVWLIEVSKYNVLPLDDRRVERFNSDLAGRPLLIKGTQQLLFNGMRRLSENSVLNVKNKSHTITCDIDVKDDHANGVVISQGGEFGGWSVYLLDGMPKYCYNLFGLRQFHVSGDAKVSAGNHQVRVEFTYDGGGLAKGGTAAIYVDGSQVGDGRVDATVPMVFSADETLDLGSDTGSPVSDEYTSATSHFTGTVNWVQLDIADEDSDHFITPEERMKIAMARQ